MYVTHSHNFNTPVRGIVSIVASDRQGRGP